jgi:hypothetical protein
MTDETRRVRERQLGIAAATTKRAQRESHESSLAGGDLVPPRRRFRPRTPPPPATSILRRIPIVRRLANFGLSPHLQALGKSVDPSLPERYN